MPRPSSSTTVILKPFPIVWIRRFLFGIGLPQFCLILYNSNQDLHPQPPAENRPGRSIGLGKAMRATGSRYSVGSL
ncbi:uncharacterized protein BDW43DRAFT_265322 [Aspergillus alliaceus]|uniref:uncharacterized protein n=1 Tax=Petromyces alliaceus TaxID=209559 RepID=UPI0012A517F7|nr:uncharacterized protein BDW43DRAFT_265322 [Aspergillus alliaceus]KAB8237373.1 hypothetical protein BDW43DRAFT_265322 [Aspergillus alliaceus]